MFDFSTIIIVFLTLIVTLVPILLIISLFRRANNSSTDASLSTLLTIDPIAATDGELLEHLQNDRKINAIKRYRELTGTGLKEAKDAVDYLEKNPDAVIEKRTNRLIMEGSAGTPFDSGIRDLIKQNKRHEAIKVYQDFTGASLSEAAVEIERLTWEIEEQDKRSSGVAE